MTLKAQVQKLPSLQVGPLCQLLCLCACPIRHWNVRALHTVTHLEERLLGQAQVWTPYTPPFSWVVRVAYPRAWAQNQKIHWGIALSCKIRILQGVRHPISWGWGVGGGQKFALQKI